MININVDRLKHTLLSMKAITDMKLSQRFFETSESVLKEKWNDADFVKSIEVHYNKLLSRLEGKDDYKVLLKHVNLVKKFREENKSEMEFRTYHQFEEYEEQVAIAYYLHDLNYLNNIYDFYKTIHKKIQKDFNLTNKSKNYGNISFYDKAISECANTKSDYFPYYIEWQSKWKEFVDAFDDNTYEYDYQDERTIVLKIDFKQSYNNLDREMYLQKIHDFQNNDLFKQDSLDAIQKLFTINEMYECQEEECDLDNNIVPYGGPLESHMLANAMILDKLEHIFKEINAKIIGDFGISHMRVDKFLAYADDIAIFIKVKSSNFKKIANDKETLCSLIIELLNNSRDDLRINSDKSHIFTFFGSDLKFQSSLMELIESYTSLSTVNSLMEPDGIIADDFDLKYDNEKDTRTIQAYKRIEEMSKLTKLEFVPLSIDEAKFSKWKKEKTLLWNMKFILEKNKTPEKSKYYFNLLLCNKGFFNDDIDNNKRFDMWWINNVVDLLLELYPINTFEYKYWGKYIYNWYFGNNNDLYNGWCSEDHKKYLGEVLLHQSDYKKSDNSMNNLYQLIEENNLNNAYIIALDHLISKIKWVTKLSRCEYDEINLNNWFFDGDNKIVDDYWSKTKQGIYIYYNNFFKDTNNFLYVRFKHFLQSSKNRIEFIKYMKYMESDLETTIDLNLMSLSDFDISFLKKIKEIYFAYSKFNNQIYNARKQIDKLWKIRILTKTLWANGSLSTQTYTIHNHLHGDVLLKRFISLNRVIPEFRSLVHKNSYSIFGFIGSIYTHDLGMLLNGNVDELFNDNLKSIYNQVSNRVRDYHGQNSSSIIMEWLASFLDIGKDDAYIMSASAIAHVNSISTLPTSDDKVKITALLLSIVDLLDVTFERSTLTSRKLTGDIASDITKKHWMKHYATRRIKSIDLEDEEHSSEGIKKLKIVLSCNKLGLSGDSLNNLEILIKEDIERWLSTLINQLFDIASKNIQGKFNIETDIVVEFDDTTPISKDIIAFREKNNKSFLEILNDLFKNTP